MYAEDLPLQLEEVLLQEVVAQDQEAIILELEDHHLVEVTEVTHRLEVHLLPLDLALQILIVEVQVHHQQLEKVDQVVHPEAQDLHLLQEVVQVDHQEVLILEVQEVHHLEAEEEIN